MFCKKCGNQIEEGAAFCKKCGTPVEQAAKTAQGIFPINEQYLKMGITVSCLLMAFATGLPYLVINDEVAIYAGAKSMSLLNADGRAGDGIVFIIIAVLALVFLHLKKNIPVLACGIASFLLYCFELWQIKKVEEMLPGYGFSVDNFMSKGAGFYLITVSVIALLALSILYFRQNRKA